MDVLADGIALGDRRDYGLAEVLRVRAREADPRDSVDRVARAQQLTELGAQLGREVAAPRVDVLSEQRDLAHAVAGKLRHLCDDVARAPALLAAPDGGDDAVGALRVAAHRDLHPRAEAPLAVHRQVGRERVVLAEAAARHTLSAGTQPFAEVRDRARPEGDVDEGILREDPLALRLGVAPADGTTRSGFSRLRAAAWPRWAASR